MPKPTVIDDPAVGRSAPKARSPEVKPGAILAVRGGECRDAIDELAVEEPLEIRVSGPDGAVHRVAVTMRTPGADFELAVGFLFTEGLIAGPADLVSERVPHRAGTRKICNVVEVPLTRNLDPSVFQRNFFATSSCGICGKAALEQIAVRTPRAASGPAASRATLTQLPEKLRQAQCVFERTGGLHAAALFTAAGELIDLREDVGRHNAVDKLFGRELIADRLPLADRILMVSGRLGFEIVQKAAVGGIPIVAAVSAPSSLAVATAERVGMTLVGFLRGDSFNVYAHPERLLKD